MTETKTRYRVVFFDGSVYNDEVMARRDFDTARAAVEYAEADRSKRYYKVVKEVIVTETVVEYHKEAVH